MNRLADLAVVGVFYLAFIVLIALAAVLMPVFWLLHITGLWTMPWEELKVLGMSIEEATESARLS